MAYAGGAAAAAAAQEARRALVGGLLVELDDEAFLRLASDHRERICVYGEVGTLNRRMAPAFSIDGLVALTKTNRDLTALLPNRKIRARRFRIPAV